MGVDSLIVRAVLGDSAVLRMADLAAGWLLTYLMHSTAVILCVWALTSWRRLSDAARDIAWKLALVGGIVTASVQTAVAPSPISKTFRLPSRAAPRPATALPFTASGPGSGDRRVVVLRPNGTRWTAALLLVWAATSGVALLWLTVSHGRTLRDIGTRDPLDDTPVGVRLRTLLRRAAVTREIRLSCSDSLTSPVALVGGEICVPRRALVELDVAEQDSMLAHELAHVVRRDPEWLVVARVIESILFMQPLNRLVRRRQQEIAEYLSDDWAITRAAHPVSLARCLASVAEWVARPRGAPSLASLSAMVETGGSPLVRRVARILGDRPRPRDRGAATTVTACVGTLVLLVVAVPRVSIAGASPPGNALMIVRSIATSGHAAAGPAAWLGSDSAMAARRDVQVLGGDRLTTVRPGVAAGGRVVTRSNVMLRRIEIRADSMGVARAPVNRPIDR